MALKVLNYLNEVVVEVKLLQRRVSLKSRNFINLVKRKDQSLQVDEPL